MRTDEDVWAFVPNHLPPAFPWVEPLVKLPTEATLPVGNLEGVGQTLSNPYPLAGPYLRRGAVASRRPEGMLTNLEQWLPFEESHQQAGALDYLQEATINSCGT